jgi:ubiquinone/menaquinone biosynthesis C-methylase UbiE
MTCCTMTSRKALTYARSHHALSNLQFELGDASSLPFADEAFAASLAQLVLTFVLALT